MIECLFDLRNTSYVCRMCRREIPDQGRGVPRCGCNLAVLNSDRPCAFHPIVLRLQSPHAIGRLVRCRRCAGNQLQKVDGVMKCLARDSRSCGSCKDLGNWAVFLLGTDDCDFWPKDT